jgi:hypothetical protein
MAEGPGRPIDEMREDWCAEAGSHHLWPPLMRFLISKSSYLIKNYVEKISGLFEVQKVPETKKYEKQGFSHFQICKPNKRDFMGNPIKN